MDIKINSSIVKQLRESKMLTQEGLAEAAKVHPRTIQRMESAGVASSKTIASVANALGVEPEKIVSSSNTSRSAAADMVANQTTAEADGSGDSNAMQMFVLGPFIGGLLGAGFGYMHSILTSAPMGEAVWGGIIWGVGIGAIIGGMITPFFISKNPHT